jgi:hypothetical protein
LIKTKNKCELGQNRIKREGMGEKGDWLLGIVMLSKWQRGLIACEELGFSQLY